MDTSLYVGGSDTRYTNYTLVETHGPKILVGWYSTVNGELTSGLPVEGETWEYDSTDEYMRDVESVPADFPAIDVDNALPGDSGTLSVGLFVAPDSESGRIWMRLNSGEGWSTEMAPPNISRRKVLAGLGGSASPGPSAEQERTRFSPTRRPVAVRSSLGRSRSKSSVPAVMITTS